MDEQASMQSLKVYAIILIYYKNFYQFMQNMIVEREVVGVNLRSEIVAV